MRKIIFQADIDSKRAQKELDKLNKEIEKSEKALDKATGQKSAIEEKLNKAKAVAKETKDYIDRMKSSADAMDKFGGEALVKKIKQMQDSLTKEEGKKSFIVRELEKADVAVDQTNARIERLKQELASEQAVGDAAIPNSSEAKESEARQAEINSKLKEAQNLLKAQEAEAAKLDEQYSKVDQKIGLMNQDLEAEMAKARELQASLDPDFSPEKYKEVTKEFAEQNKQVESLNSQLEKADTAVQSITKDLDRQKAAAGKIEEQMSKAYDPAKLKEAMNGVQTSLKGGFKTLLKYGIGIRSLFVLFNKLRQIITAGLQEFSKYDPATNKAITNIKNGFTKLKASLTSAFAPLLQTLEPILTKLINWFAKLIDYVGMFFTALSGKSVYKKAVSYEQSYSDALKETGKEAKKTSQYLSGLDEIRTYDTQQDTSIASAAEDANKIMTGIEEVEMPSWMKKLADFMDKVKNFNLKTWWKEKVSDPIKNFNPKQWWNEHVKEPIQNFDLKGKWQEKVVKPIKEGWEKTKEDWNNNVVTPIKNLDIKGKWQEKVVKPIKEGWEKTKADWNNNVATPIKDFDIKGKWQENVVKPIKEGLDKTAGDAENWWTNDVSPWFTKERWEKLGQDTSEGFQSKFQSITGCDSPKAWWETKAKPWLTRDKWATIGEDASKGFKEKFKSITGCESVKEWWDTKAKPYLETADWSQIGKDISSCFSNGFKTITGCDSIRQWWDEKVKPWFTWEKWKQLGKDAIDAIVNGLKSIQLPKFHLTWGTDTKAVNLLGYTKYIQVPWPHLDFYARGGIVDRATLFGNSVIGEAGKEAIIPLERNTEWIRKVADELADILVDRLGQIIASYPLPAAASGSLIPPRIEIEIDGMDGVARQLDTIINSINRQRGGSYAFTAQVNRKTLFTEVINEAKIQQASNGRNPFELR